jgi:hypothetical protein
MDEQDKDNLHFLLNAEAENLVEVLSDMSEDDLDYALELLDKYEQNLDEILVQINDVLGIDSFESDLTIPEGVTIH